MKKFPIRIIDVNVGRLSRAAAREAGSLCGIAETVIQAKKSAALRAGRL